jgi:energy-coupling factor transporter ATP-binding protein EcfA2
MDQGIESISPRGSTWHRWDPHIHAPGTALNDQYCGTDPWVEFLDRIEQSEPPVRALGITDYCGIDTYRATAAYRKAGRLNSVGLIFPNVEFRLALGTTKGPGINVHLLFSPEAPDHVDRICEALGGLIFRYQDEEFRCTRAGLTGLGRAFDPSQSDDDAAYREGVKQFKVTYEGLEHSFKHSAWLRAHCLVAVAGGTKDGMSGLQGEGGQWGATRNNLCRFADIVFTSNAKDIAFFLGKGAATPEALLSQVGGRKPCLHGSDAHAAGKVAQPDQSRYCWLSGDLTFDTLRQAVIEPEGRVHIGVAPPQGALPGNAIRSVRASNAPWINPPQIPINAGMVAIIGARGSGKTALADLIATGAYGIGERMSDNSFLRRAEKYLRHTSVELEWENGERTSNAVSSVQHETLFDAPHVQYLSQQFVEQLCSSEGLDDTLVSEIQRVIFESHAEEVRIDSIHFDDLLDRRMRSVREARDRHRHALERATEAINVEHVRKESLGKLEKERAENLKLIKKDREDRKQLVPKGQEQRSKRLEEVSAALENKQRAAAAVQARALALTGLQADVVTFRQQTALEWVSDAKERRADAGLSEGDWKVFGLEFVGDVDVLLRDRVEHAKTEAARIQGADTRTEIAGPQPLDPKVALVADDADLSAQPLNLLIQERTRLQRLSGIDEQNARRYKLLTERIARAETTLVKQNTDIERASKADEVLKQLRTARTDAYQGIFTAIIEEEGELRALYEPLQERIAVGPRAVKKLAFSVRRQVDMDEWAAHGEQLLDLRKGPFKGKGELLKAADDLLGFAWRQGSAEEAAAAMNVFVEKHVRSLMDQRPNDMPFRDWTRRAAEWLYGTDHIQVGYGLCYDDVDIERLSPGTRGIVLLLLYLALDAEDDRPLIIDQPEENLDPQSVFEELVPAFCDAKQRRQIIIVTHNANLVVNADVNQVIVARCGPHLPDQLPKITYESGGLENPRIREAVCAILEGGERAFQERARRLRVKIGGG